MVSKLEQFVRPLSRMAPHTSGNLSSRAEYTQWDLFYKVNDTDSHLTDRFLMNYWASLLNIRQYIGEDK